MDKYRPISGISLPSPEHRATRFPAYVQEMNSSRRPKNQVPSSLAFWTVILTIAVMLTLALGIEFALYFSNKNHGFPVGSFNTEQIQWLSGFLPVLGIGPLVWIWNRMDRDIKRLQPYVALSKGPSRAQESVLMDLEHENLLKLLPRCFQSGNSLILGTSIIVFLNIFLPPLAASFFIVKEGSGANSSIPVRGETTLGLNPSYKDMSAFVAAAGYSEAAAFYNLSDPPFVHGGWTVADFKLPSGFVKNYTLSVNTTAVYTNVSCVSATVSLGKPTEAAPLNWTLTASLPGAGPECTATQTIDSSVAELHYGIDPMPGCPVPLADGFAKRFPVLNGLIGSATWLAVIPVTRPNAGAINTNETLQTRDASEPRGSAVICTPHIKGHAVEAIVDGTTGLILGVNVIGDADINNVTHAFDGLFFDASLGFDLNDTSVKSGVLTVQSGLPGSIIRLVTGEADMDAIFDTPMSFLQPVQKFYTQYLSTVARSIYFVQSETPLDANVRISSLRLWIHPISAHVLVVLFLLVALFGTVIHIIHRRHRRYLYLVSHPGTIAHYMGLLSHPRMTALTVNDDARPMTVNGLVGPQDDWETMGKRLEGLWFMLDRRSGGVVPVVPGENWALRSGYRGDHSDQPSEPNHEMEDARKSLLSAEYPPEE